MSKKKYYSVPDVMGKLGVQNVTEIVGPKMKEFLNLIPQMNDAAASTIVDEITNNETMALEMFNGLRDMTHSVLCDDDKENMEFTKSCQQIIDSLNDLLQSSEYTHEQRMEVTDKVKEILEIMNERSAMNKQFKGGALHFLGEAGKALLFAAGTAVAVVATVLASKNGNSNSSGNGISFLNDKNHR